jgi:hypothetical protein
MILLFQQRSVIRYHCLRGKRVHKSSPKLNKVITRMHCAFRLWRNGQRDFEQAGRLSRKTRGQEGTLRTILVMHFSDFVRRNLILPPARSVTSSTHQGRQFSEFWRTSGFISSPRDGYPMACLMLRRPIGSTFSAYPRDDAGLSPKQQKYFITVDRS